MKNFLFFLTLLGSVIPMSAESFVSNGLSFEINESDGSVSLTNADESLVGVVNIPGTVTFNSTEFSVKKIDTFAFSKCKQVTDIIIPSTVTSISQGAFLNCSALSYVEISNGSTPINIYSDTFGSPFEGTSLQTLFVGRNVADGSNAPWNNLNFNKLILGSGITTIKHQSFLYAQFKEIELMYSETPLHIGYSRMNNVGEFEKCQTLLKAYVDRILQFTVRNEKGKSLFEYVPNLEYLELGSHLTYVQESLACSCRKLSTVVLPPSITHIYDNAFAFSYIENINLPNGLEYIGASAFTSTHIESLDIPSTVTSMGNSPFWQSEIKSVRVPGSLVNMPYGTFSNCSQLTDVQLMDGIVNMNDFTFNCCYKLKHVSFPSTINYIGAQTFNICNSLERIQSFAVEPPTLVENTFTTEQYLNLIVEVPKNSVAKYKEAPYWKFFQNIIEYNEAGIDDIVNTESLNIVAIYDMNGNVVTHPSRGVFVVKYENGICKKVIY